MTIKLLSNRIECLLPPDTTYSPEEGQAWLDGQTLVVTPVANIHTIPNVHGCFLLANLLDPNVVRACKSAVGASWTSRGGLRAETATHRAWIVVESDMQTMTEQRDRRALCQSLGLPAPSLVCMSGVDVIPESARQVLYQSMSAQDWDNLSIDCAMKAIGSQTPDNERDAWTRMSNAAKTHRLPDDLTGIAKKGKSQHVYYALDRAYPIDDPRVAAVIDGLTAVLGADVTTRDKVRAMRCPDAITLVDGRVGYQPVIEGTEQKYTLDQLEAGIDACLDAFGINIDRAINALKTAGECQSKAKAAEKCGKSDLADRYSKIGREIYDALDITDYEKDLVELESQFRTSVQKKIQSTVRTYIKQHSNTTHSGSKDLASIVVSLGLRKLATGRYECPACGSDHDPLQINSDYAYCHRCKRSFSPVELVRVSRGCTYAEARRWIDPSAPVQGWIVHKPQQVSSAQNGTDLSTPIVNEDLSSSVCPVSLSWTRSERVVTNTWVRPGQTVRMHITTLECDSQFLPEDLLSTLPVDLKSFRACLIESAMGTRKTGVMADYIRQQEGSLSLVPRISLADRDCKLLSSPSFNGRPGIDIVNYQSTTEPLTAPHVGCCLDSVHRIRGAQTKGAVARKVNRVLVLDESETFFPHLFGGTIKADSAFVLERLRDLASTAPLILCADANLSSMTLEGLASITTENDLQVLEIKNTWRHKSTPVFHTATRKGYAGWYEHLSNAIKAQPEKIHFVPCTSKKKTKALARHLAAEGIGGVKVIHSSTPASEIAELSSDPDGWVRRQVGMRVLIASPTIQTGISFNDQDVWGSIHCYVHTGLHTAQDVSQMPARVRYPEHTDIHYCIQDKRERNSIDPKAIMMQWLRGHELTQSLIVRSGIDKDGDFVRKPEETVHTRLAATVLAWRRQHGLNGLWQGLTDYYESRGVQIEHFAAQTSDAVVDSVNKAKQKINKDMQLEEVDAQFAAQRDDWDDAAMEELQNRRAPLSDDEHIEVSAWSRQRMVGRFASKEEIAADLKGQKRKAGTLCAAVMLYSDGDLASVAKTVTKRVGKGTVASKGNRLFAAACISRYLGIALGTTFNRHCMPKIGYRVSDENLDAAYAYLRQHTKLISENMGINFMEEVDYQRALTKYNDSVAVREAALATLPTTMSKKERKSAAKAIRDAMPLAYQPKTARRAMSDMLRQIGMHLTRRKRRGVYIYRLSAKTVHSAAEWATSTMAKWTAPTQSAVAATPDNWSLLGNIPAEWAHLSYEEVLARIM